MMRRHLRTILALGLIGLTAGCFSNEKLNSPSTPTGGAIFTRYVAMGNSITAGFQSAGINDSTQQQSYAHLLATAMGTPYYYASLNGPGCPPPFDNNATQHRVGGGTSVTCFAQAGAPHPYLTNVAVPGVRAGDVINNFEVPVSASNALTTIILGGRTQVQAMLDAQPTFVSAWVGNNDVLGALTNGANPGLPAAVTSSATFNAQYDTMAAAIVSTGAKAILIGVADVTNIPYTSPGTTYWCLKTGACGIPAAGFPAGFTVLNNCAPDAAIPGSKGDSILVPWTVGVPLIGAAALGATDTLDCSVDAEVVTPTEYALLRNAVVADNAHIQSVATAHGWAYFDPNPALAALKADPSKVAPFPGLGAPGTNILFGSMFTLDGVHPSRTAHILIADSLVATINAKYGTTLTAP